MNDHELIIFNRGKAYFPSIIEPIEFEDELKGTPSKLSFTVIKGQKLNFQEGNPIRYRYKGKDIFFGFVFTKSRSKEHHIKVTAYDQMRYLKNKDTILFKNKTADEVLKQIASIHPSIQLGRVDNTGFKIKSLLCDNESYLDMIYNALDYTITHRKKGYVLLDNFGKLELRDIDKMQVSNFIVTEDNAEDFDYESTIDKETYNQIKLVYENDKTGKREVYMTKDTDSINRWGLLQYFEIIDENVNGKLKADTLLELHNRKTRTLSVSGLKGITGLRAGYRVPVMLNLGDTIVQNYLIINNIVHTFNESEHTMEIGFIGGGFSA